MIDKNEISGSSLREVSKKITTGFQSVYTEEQLILHNEFFKRVVRELNLKKIDADIVAVIHILSDAVPFAWALSTIANINAIVPKPKSINKIVLNRLKGFPIKNLSRENAGNIINSIRKKTVFLDIGGYFSGAIDELQKSLGKNFCGVVEDTENGLRRYMERGINFPFISVARSPLKDNEDKIVGQSIAFSAEKIWRQHCKIPNGFQLGVIGYGKIGKSVANSFRQKCKVSIYDQNNILLTHAVSDGFYASDKAKILYESDAICLATGNISLSYNDFSNLKNGSWVFSVTSSDDEIDTVWLNKNYKADRLSTYVEKYSNSNRKHYFYLMNKGNAINFIDGAAVGDFILLVHAELLVAAYKLMANEVEIGKHEIAQETRDKICQVWLSIFKPQSD